MESTNTADLSMINDLGEVVVKLEADWDKSSVQQKEYHKSDSVASQISKTHIGRLDSEENRSSSALGSGRSGLTVLEQESLANDSSPCSTSPISSAPLCRQFWKAGNYDQGRTSKITLQNATGYLHIHPRFLHSNATSHKWAFGAIAELLDNAVDEIHRGATFVTVDKISNPRDGNPALLIQDDGGGMDPEAMRGCLSFGFSDKKNKSAIGQYGNGFKTSSMRLGADVVVFSRCMKDRKLTQSIGLLSYTFLMQTGLDRIVVPMVNYELDASTGKWNFLHTKQHFVNNLSMLLRWSPYATEEKLLKQFEAVGNHGTKIIIYNLWCNDEGKMELDFDSDPEDIRILVNSNHLEKVGSRMTISEQHLANRLRYSLRAYLSILYLRTPNNFSMLLRGTVVEYHNIANDLKYPEFIMYRPQSGGNVEGSVITTIGFLKEAPLVNIHGFNVYHKNRLILPFWHVVSYSDSRGRGVVGVLETNFIEPTHNKQEFEKTPVFQKLEQRLKEMTWEYWDYHCGLLGYQSKRKARPRPMEPQGASSTQFHGKFQPVLLGGKPSAATSAKSSLAPGASQRQPGASSNSFAARSGNLSSSQKNLQQGGTVKRKERDYTLELQNMKRKAGTGANEATRGLQPERESATTQPEDQEAANLIQENKKLRTQCSEHEKSHEELQLKVTRLRTELKQAQREYARLLIESRITEKVKHEKNVVV